MAALSCPSCGATHEPRNPGIAVIVCDNCDTTLYVEEEVLKAGRKAVVGEPKSGMGLGTKAHGTNGTWSFPVATAGGWSKTVARLP
jgi:hypothetical protein